MGTVLFRFSVVRLVGRQCVVGVLGRWAGMERGQCSHGRNAMVLQSMSCSACGLTCEMVAI